MTKYEVSVKRALQGHGLSPHEAQCVVDAFHKFIASQSRKRIPASTTADTLSRHPDVRAQCRPNPRQSPWLAVAVIGGGVAAGILLVRALS
jgi:hypothetical protein